MLHHQINMSKAFTRENDNAPDDEIEDEGPKLPPGTKNYMTHKCAEKMRTELKHLRYRERPETAQMVNWAAQNGDRSENADYTYNKRRLAQIDRRLRYLSKRLESADIIDPVSVKSDQILFGATVTIRDEDGTEQRYSIVGVDEVDVKKGKISWQSPIANSLFKAKEGDLVTFRSPKGVREIEIIKIRYIEIQD